MSPKVAPVSRVALERRLDRARTRLKDEVELYEKLTIVRDRLSIKTYNINATVEACRENVALLSEVYLSAQLEFQAATTTRKP